jgi:hypothetical protein
VFTVLASGIVTASRSVLIELTLPGTAGTVVANVVDAATGETLTDVMFGLDSLHPDTPAPSGRFSWFTRRTAVALAAERSGYDAYTMPCRLKVPVDDSVTVRIWLPALGPGARRPLALPGARPRGVLVVNDTVWTPGSASPNIPPQDIVSNEMLSGTIAEGRYGQCGAQGASIISTRRPILN